MKPMLFNLLVVLLVAGRSTGTPGQVLDTDGLPLTTESSYSIITSGDAVEGLSLLAPDGGLSCPPYVVHATKARQLPVRIRPFNSNDLDKGTKPVVNLLTDVNLDFHVATRCPESPVWHMRPIDVSLHVWRFVTGGGVLGNKTAVADWFKIDEYGDGYKLMYCPSQCVGLSLFNNTLLGLPPPELKVAPLLVKFKRAAI